ncbi:MAG: hypothetical protein AAGA08_14110 [Pseudomonadota bacterium]
MRRCAGGIAALFLCAGASWSQAQPEKPLPVDGRIAADGSSIELTLTHADPPRVGNVSVKRRTLGERGGDTWRAVAPQLGPVMRFTDNDVQPGTAYEYQVMRTARDIVDLGYFTAGVEVPAVETRGKVLLVVDETMAKPLRLRLDRFERDLIGDGWEVVRHLTPRGPSGDYVESLNRAVALKSWVQDQYFSDPFARHALILFGHVPIALTGRAAPDGHDAVPHASDLFYAEVDGEWRLRRTAEGHALLGENRLPSDAIEMQVGRIDFRPVAAGNRTEEVALLQAYLDKNHHWRHGLLGDLRGAYAKTGHLRVERDGIRNIVGSEFLIEGGHHDVGEERPWLWGVDFGDWNGGRYASDYENKSAFVINFGSGKQKIEKFGNALTASLAQPWYTVAAGWGGRPSWRLHHMALGATIGEAHWRTVNNGVATEPYRESMDYFPTGNYLWRNPVWVNLLGDPSLRAFMLTPPSGLQASRDGTDMRLRWTASPAPAVESYTLYRADTPDARFMPIAHALTGTEYLDRSAPEDARYMLRAYGLQQVAAGSFYTYSQGVFTEPGVDGLSAPDRPVSLRPGETVALDLVDTDATSGVTEAFLRGPDQGHLARVEGIWQYTAPEGANSQITLPYTRSSAAGTAVGRFVLNIDG